MPLVFNVLDVSSSDLESVRRTGLRGNFVKNLLGLLLSNDIHLTNVEAELEVHMCGITASPRGVAHRITFSTRPASVQIPPEPGNTR